MPVGVSPVQLRITKAEGRHTKNPVIRDGFFVGLIVLNSVGGELLFAILKLHIGHDAPKSHIARTHPSEYHPYFDVLVPHDGNKSPILNFLHGNRAVSCGGFTNRGEHFTIFLNCSRFADNIERERKQAKLEELRLLFSLTSCRKLEVVEAIRVEYDLRLEVWAVNLPFGIKNFPCLVFPFFKICVVYIHVSHIIQILPNNSKDKCLLQFILEFK